MCEPSMARGEFLLGFITNETENEVEEGPKKNFGKLRIKLEF